MSQSLQTALQADVAIYRKKWIDDCRDYGELNLIYPEFMSMIDWLNGVPSQQFRAVMMVALFEDESRTTAHTSDEHEVSHDDLVAISKWRKRHDKVNVWESIYALPLRDSIYLHRLYELGDESYLVGFLLPKTDEIRVQLLDIQSRYIARKWS